MVYCVAIGCNSNSCSRENISFFRFSGRATGNDMFVNRSNKVESRSTSLLDNTDDDDDGTEMVLSHGENCKPGSPEECWLNR